MKWRRRQYLIDQKFQWRFVQHLITPLIIGMIIITFVDYYFIWSLFTFPGRYENMELISLKIISYILFYTMCIFIPIVAIVGVIVSHRVAGPLFQIERILNGAGGGDISTRVTLRQKDELKNLAVSINEMLSGLSDKISVVEKIIKDLEEKLLALESESEKELPNINKIREELKSILSSFTSLKDNLNKFKK